MNYGYFDIENKEYVITQPDTPTPWMNYLGNGGFSGMISNNAGGLLFDGDPGNRRLTRYKYNALPVDRPGRYLYIRDMETGEYWAATWQPVLKPYEFYECRHGLGYTTIKTQTSGIEIEITYYIPEGKKYEIWNAKIVNKSGRPRKLKLFSYIEFSHYSASIDVTCEWARYEMLAECVDDIIICDAAVEVCPTGIMYGIMGTNLPVDGYDCYRDRFIGAYRSESNPIVVEQGESLNTHVGADQICGSLSSSMELASGEQKDFIFTVGIVDAKEKAPALVAEATDPVRAAAALAQIKASWEKHLLNCQIETPDADMNKMINIWHAYQCKMTFDWSRFISYYERGIVRGWGFRDSMQDVLGVMHALAPLAKERIKTLLGIQRSSGNARSVYYPATKKSEGGDRSDDHIWSIFSVCTYIRETGDYAFLNEMVPWEDGGEATVVEHLIRGLDFTRKNVGAHGIPNFLNSDWNDSICAINREGKAESVFVFFQAAHAAYELKLLFKQIGDGEKLAWAEDYYAWCRDMYNSLWDGKWFLRAYLSNGEKYGTDEDEENKIFLNPQSWAVLSRLPSPEQGNSAFDEVYKRLFCEFGLISHAPASSKYYPEKKSFMDFPRGIKENGGVFCHANTWAVIAETLLGRNNEAFEIYRASLPCRRNERAEQTLIEPYVYGSAQLGPAHERFGAGSNSWLTGTASWMYFTATQYILGFRPDYDGIVIDPCIPDSWDGFKMKRNYRGTECTLTVGKRPEANAKVKALLVDGERIEGNFLSAKLLEGKKKAEITAVF
ncbi:MAG: glycosyl transferase [Ruminococcaceae bacterium]|nr:glycosyl transferase [Oscillospiraceae bacterium]